MDTYEELTTFSKKNKPKVDQLVILSRDLMGYGTFSNEPPLKHNHGKIIRIIPDSERKDRYQTSRMYTLVQIELPNGEKIKAYSNDIKPLF